MHQEVIQKLKTATGSLMLDLGYKKIRGVSSIGEEIATNSKLTSLTLNLDGNHIRDISSLGKGIENNSKLTSLTLNLWYNKITNIDAIGKGIENNSKLTSLILELAYNQITNIDVKLLAGEIRKSHAKITLYYDGNNIKNEGEEAIKEALALNADAKHREQKKNKRKAMMRLKLSM